MVYAICHVRAENVAIGRKKSYGTCCITLVPVIGTPLQSVGGSLRPPLLQNGA